MPKNRPHRRHYRVTLADAKAANQVAISFGGLPGIRREADILSAIGRPYIGYYRPIYSKAAALFQSIATNHGFNDGNKRSAILLSVLLIERSGFELRPHGREDLGDALEALALHVVNDRPPLAEIAAWFRLRIRRGNK